MGVYMLVVVVVPPKSHITPCSQEMVKWSHLDELALLEDPLMTAYTEHVDMVLTDFPFGKEKGHAPKRAKGASVREKRRNPSDVPAILPHDVFFPGHCPRYAAGWYGLLQDHGVVMVRCTEEQVGVWKDALRALASEWRTACSTFSSTQTASASMPRTRNPSPACSSS